MKMMDTAMFKHHGLAVFAYAAGNAFLCVSVKQCRRRRQRKGLCYNCAV